MTVPVRGRVPLESDGRFGVRQASHIGERLRALEKAFAGGSPEFLAPGQPTFGSGIVPSPGSGGGSGGAGGGGSTTVIETTVDDGWTSRFLLMGA